MNVKEITRYIVLRNFVLFLCFLVLSLPALAQQDSIHIQSNKKDTVTWHKNISEVVVKAHRIHYKRKGNPAVELMRRVIAAKKHTDLHNHDWLSYDKYQKITVSVNDIQPEDLEKKYAKKRQYILDQVEVSPWNNKLILPISMDETLTHVLWRRQPQKEREIIGGRQTVGITKLWQTGDVFNVMLKDAFTDVDLYEDHIRLLRFPFTSPIGNTAISFYHFYIVDTVKVDRDSCFHLAFMPANKQDIGFSGNIWIVKDSTLHVKRCELTLPKQSGVNWIDKMKVIQQYDRLDNGEWVLTQDDMAAEMKVTNFLPKALIVRTTRLSRYSFDPIREEYLTGPEKVLFETDALRRKDIYWQLRRQAPLTESEAHLPRFVKAISHSHGFGLIRTIWNIGMENFAEIIRKDSASVLDLGPVNTFLSKNYVDGIRLRLAARTQAALSPHWFWDGYGAYGTKSHRWYYGTNITYSLNRKKNAAFEFPMRSISFESTSDVMSESDRNLLHNKDNIFMTFRAATENKMFFYNRQRLSFNYETLWGLRWSGALTTESNRTAGTLHYIGMDNNEIFKIRKSNVTLGIAWDPNIHYMNTKQQRFPVNQDSPNIALSHTMDFKGFLGGSYRSNTTTLSFYKRTWLGSWGNIMTFVTAKAQWNKVPFPYLVLPPINLSYMETPNTFMLMKDWEFMNDRQLFWSLAWQMNGKILNRIPLIKKLKWREYFAVKGMLGHLTDKNNHFLERNAHDTMLFRFPSGSHVMGNTPYWEYAVGLSNVFKFFTIEYTRRLTYLRPDTHKWGIRLAFDISF